MYQSLLTLAGWATVIALITALALAAVKLVHREILRWRGVRSAHYIAAVGEMVSRQLIPGRIPEAWSQDPLFHDAITDYRLLVTGSDRAFIDELVDHMGIHEVLIARSRRKFLVATRLRAVSSLVDLADHRHRNHLRELLDDSSHHVRVHAVHGLSRLGDLVSVPRVLDMATDVRPWEAARLADALAAMGSGAVLFISQWIEAELAEESPSVEVVTLATRVLGLIADPSAEKALIPLLRSGHPEWRMAAASALERTGTDAAVPPLVAALDDESWRVKVRAVAALGNSSDPAVVPAVARLLSDPVWWVRQNAAAALATLPGGIEQLVRSLDDPDPFAVDAALNQLTESGAIGEALERVADGQGNEADERLVAVAGSSR